MNECFELNVKSQECDLKRVELECDLFDINSRESNFSKIKEKYGYNTMIPWSIKTDKGYERAIADLYYTLQYLKDKNKIDSQTSQWFINYSANKYPITIAVLVKSLVDKDDFVKCINSEEKIQFLELSKKNEIVDLLKELLNKFNTMIKDVHCDNL